MSYFARLRQQSGLRVMTPDASPEPALSPHAPTSASGLEATEVVEIVSPPDPDAMRSLPAPPPAAPMPRPVPPPAPASQSPELPSTTLLPSKRGETRRPEPTAAPLGVPSEAATPNPDDGHAIDQVVLSREETLRRVFQWLAASPAPPREGESTPLESVRQSERIPVAGETTEAIETVAMSPPGSPPQSAPMPRTAPFRASRTEAEDVEIVEAAKEPQVRRVASSREAPWQNAATLVEESVTVSIGPINVRVEAPSPAPPPPVRPAAAPGPIRVAKRPASRLARHYLRP